MSQPSGATIPPKYRAVLGTLPVPHNYLKFWPVTRKRGLFSVFLHFMTFWAPSRFLNFLFRLALQGEFFLFLWALQGASTKNRIVHLHLPTPTMDNNGHPRGTRRILRSLQESCCNTAGTAVTSEAFVAVNFDHLIVIISDEHDQTIFCFFHLTLLNPQL